MTPTSFVDAKGGPAQIASDIAKAVADEGRHIKAGAIALWKYRNKLPRDAWPELQQAYPDLTLDELIEIEKRSGKDQLPGAA